MWNKTTPDPPLNQDELMQKPTCTILSLIEMGEGRSQVFIYIDQAQVVWKVDNAIQWINHYPANSVVSFGKIYLMNSNLSDG